MYCGRLELEVLLALALTPRAQNSTSTKLRTLIACPVLGCIIPIASLMDWRVDASFSFPDFIIGVRKYSHAIIAHDASLDAEVP